MQSKLKKSESTAHVAPMTLKEFRGRLASYDETFLECKDMRHRWVLVQSYERQPNGWVTRVLECDRCGTVRTDKYAIVGGKRLARAGSNYQYPQGFSFRGLPKEDNLSEVVRYEAFRRAVEGATGGN